MSALNIEFSNSSNNQAIESVMVMLVYLFSSTNIYSLYFVGTLTFLPFFMLDISELNWLII